MWGWERKSSFTADLESMGGRCIMGWKMIRMPWGEGVEFGMLGGFGLDG